MKVSVLILFLVLAACASTPQVKQPSSRAVAAVDESHWPKTLTPEQEAAMPIEMLEALYLKERCGTDNCESVIQFEVRPADILTAAEQIVIQKYTETFNIENDRIMAAGVAKLPPMKIVGFHGGNSRHFGKLKKDQEIVLERLTSISTDRTKAEDFIRDELWQVQASTARDIQSYSVVGEHEYLLVPGTRLKVSKPPGTTKVDFSVGNTKKKPVDVSFIQLSEIK